MKKLFNHQLLHYPVQRKLFTPLLILAFLCTVLVSFLVVTDQNRKATRLNTSASSDLIDFYLNPSSLSVQAEDTFPTDIFVNPNGNDFTAATIYLEFDNTKITPIDIQPNSAFMLLSQDQITSNLLSFSIGATCKPNGTCNTSQEASQIATVTWAAQDVGTVTISTTSQSLATALNNTQNLAGDSDSSTITITAAQPTEITPTPEPPIDASCSLCQKSVCDNRCHPKEKGTLCPDCL